MEQYNKTQQEFKQIDFYKSRADNKFATNKHTQQQTQNQPVRQF